MDENRKKELEKIVDGMWKAFEEIDIGDDEEFVPAVEAKADRVALGRKIARLHLAYARALIEKYGEEEGKKVILEALRDYSYHCAEIKKKGMIDLPTRFFHDRIETTEENDKRKLRAYGCAMAREYIDQGEEKLGSVFCYVDPCTSLFTTPNVKLYHKKLEPLGHGYCEFDIDIVSDEEMRNVSEKGRDYSYINPILEDVLKEGGLLKNKQD